MFTFLFFCKNVPVFCQVLFKMPCAWVLFCDKNKRNFSVVQNWKRVILKCSPFTKKTCLKVTATPPTLFIWIKTNLIKKNTELQLFYISCSSTDVNARASRVRNILSGQWLIRVLLWPLLTANQDTWLILNAHSSSKGTLWIKYEPD